MKILPSIFKILLGTLFVGVTPSLAAQSQTGDPDSPATTSDTTVRAMNVDAIYNRPLMQFENLPVAIGGYVEANSEYRGSDGVTEGISFHMRRTTIFISSSIHERISFITEIEFEDGAKEIALETALLDLELTPTLILRGGVLLNPIGAFNQNHDGPKWEFIDRPVSATRMLPATWSNVGFGVHGKFVGDGLSYAYEVYLTNGFDGSIISNGENRTSLPAAKENPERFEESTNGVPLLSAKVAFRNRLIGEIGLSYMGGIYNQFETDGLVLDEKRRLDIFALDFHTTIPGMGMSVTGEAALITVDIPSTYTQQFGRRQWGGYVDIVQPIVTATIFGFERSVLLGAVRIEYVDWNVDTFNETGGDIGDEFSAVVPAISWRPTGQTVLRLNYRYEWHTDLFPNRASRIAVVQFGFSTYF